MVRRIKALYQLYNYFQRKKLSHLTSLYKQLGINKSYHSSVSSADFEHLPQSPNKFDRLDSSEYLPDDDTYNSLPELRKDEILNWSRDGYAILRGFFSDEKVATVNDEIDRMLKDGTVKFRHAEKKIEFAIRHSQLLRDLGTHPQLLKILNLLLDREAVLFQSLNFINGSQQRTHSDSIHMTTYPLGNLIAVWIALEDVGPEQGPLHYYPGSHKLPYLLNNDLGNRGNKWLLGDRGDGAYEDLVQQTVDQENFNKRVLTAKKGDVLIWHANLLHGGEPVKDSSLTRKSMVLHYFGQGAICYHEITQRPALMEDFMP